VFAIEVSRKGIPGRVARPPKLETPTSGVTSAKTIGRPVGSPAFPGTREATTSRALRSRRWTAGPARQKSRFCPHFVSFQALAGRKISPRPSRRSRVSRDRRLTIGGNDVSHRPSPDASWLRCLRATSPSGSSPPSERCRRGSCADSETCEAKSGRAEDPSIYSLFQKDNSGKKCGRCPSIAIPSFDPSCPRPRPITEFR
jgi:hypothetical protein